MSIRSIFVRLLYLSNGCKMLAKFCSERYTSSDGESLQAGDEWNQMKDNCIQRLDWNVRRKKVLLLDQGRAPGWSRRSPAKSCLVLFSHERTIKITHEASSAIRRHHAGYVGFEAHSTAALLLCMNSTRRRQRAPILTLQDRGTGLSGCQGCGREEELGKARK